MPHLLRRVPASASAHRSSESWCRWQLLTRPNPVRGRLCLGTTRWRCGHSVRPETTDGTATSIRSASDAQAGSPAIRITLPGVDQLQEPAKRRPTDTSQSSPLTLRRPASRTSPRSSSGPTKDDHRLEPLVHAGPVRIVADRPSLNRCRTRGAERRDTSRRRSRHFGASASSPTDEDCSRSGSSSAGRARGAARTTDQWR